MGIIKQIKDLGNTAYGAKGMTPSKGLNATAGLIWNITATGLLIYYSITLRLILIACVLGACLIIMAVTGGEDK